MIGCNGLPFSRASAFTWEDAVQPFDTLTAGRVDQGLSGEIKDVVHSRKLEGSDGAAFSAQRAEYDRGPNRRGSIYMQH